MYAHTAQTLFSVHAETLLVTELGAITFEDESGAPIFSETMTDLAVDATGRVFACSFDALYRLDVVTRTATRVGMIDQSFNGLTFVPAGRIDPANEVLIGTSGFGGLVSRVDLDTAVTTAIGSYGGGWESSGDVVAVVGDDLYATVRSGGGGDYLARIDPATAQATALPNPIGFNRIWGLGYWNGVLYGFNDSGQIVAIDRDTGVGSLVRAHGAEFYGAGVTTLAPTP